MFDQINTRLTQAKSRLRSKHKLESKLRQIKQVCREEESKCSSLEKQLDEEKSDVDQLEGLSLTGLFYSVLGTKHDKLEKERQEFLAAKLKYDEAVEALADSRQEMKRIQNELTGLTQAEIEYHQRVREKQDLLAGVNDDRSEKLLAMSEVLSDLNCDGKELQEAMEAGQAALDSLQEVKSELQSAANWGTLDLLGGGFISTMAKHSQIDLAKEHAHRAQQQLRRFQEELVDADQRLQLSLDLGSFSTFADFFFDGLIFDWAVQSEINQASSACDSTISQVSTALRECQRRLTETEWEIEKTTRRKNEFIEQA